MENALISHIRNYLSLSVIESKEIWSFFRESTYSKKEIVMEMGDKDIKNYFIAKGCVHLYFIAENGRKQTVQFAIENWWITDTLAFLKCVPSNFYIQAIEKTVVYHITKRKYDELLSKYPKLEKYFRIINQIAHGASLLRIRYTFDLSKEESYFNFVQQYPEFEQRVPQYLIASYLGLTPEYVSEIRTKRFS